MTWRVTPLADGRSLGCVWHPAYVDPVTNTTPSSALTTRVFKSEPEATTWARKTDQGFVEAVDHTQRMLSGTEAPW